MADFPAIPPRRRSFGFGEFPISQEPGNAGQVSLLHGDESVRQPLRLFFVRLRQSDARLLRNHYRNQRGTNIPFALSPITWAGHTSQTDLVPSTTRWRYAMKLQESQKDGGFIDVEVQLVAVINSD
jgi:hypothetical protein